MDDRTFDGAVRRWAAALTRRRAGALLTAGLASAVLGRSPVAAARCRKRLADCTAKAQCCGKKTLCSTSHGAGSKTCCGGKGATCTSDLTCCIKFMCENGRCVVPPPE